MFVRIELPKGVLMPSKRGFNEEPSSSVTSSKEQGSKGSIKPSKSRLRQDKSKVRDSVRNKSLHHKTKF